VVVGLLLVWGYRFTIRYLGEPAAFWQGLQDRWRPIWLVSFAVGGATAIAGGALCWASGLHTLGAGVVAFGAVFAAISAAMMSGLIRPKRYDRTE
jgi:hypothetical protein